MLLSQLKSFVFERANGFCEYCKSPANVSPQPFVLEHILPKSRGGKTIEQNLAMSCQGCNNYKFTKTTGIDAISNQCVAHFSPRSSTWNDHFRWDEEVLEIIGITATGRASVVELKLNRQELKNLRKLLADAGMHPPK